MVRERERLFERSLERSLEREREIGRWIAVVVVDRWMDGQVNGQLIDFFICWWLFYRLPHHLLITLETGRGGGEGGVALTAVTSTHGFIPIAPHSIAGH